MKTTLVIAAMGLVGFLGSLVFAQDRAPLPPGVSEQQWIPIAENFGFVITKEAAALHPDTLTGHFVARQGDVWKKVDSEGGFRFQPLQK